MRNSTCKPINPLVDRFFQKNAAVINSPFIDDIYPVHKVEKAQIQHNNTAINKLTDSYVSKVNNSGLVIKSNK